jgi:ribosomal protein S18 acetylase RimI-like enzyme
MTQADLWQALEASWPAASRTAFGPFIWREGAGGGSRVSAATVQHRPNFVALDKIESKFSSANRDALFQIRDADDSFDSDLAQRGYDIVDPTVCLAAPVESFAKLDPKAAYISWPPIAAQRDIWKIGGIDSARINVMKRVQIPKTTLLARNHDAPAGAAFIAALGSIAVLHALEISPKHRRRGLARAMMCHAANWAKTNSATTLAVLVTRANTEAIALYSSLGMREVGHYHYRRKRTS